MYIWLFGLLEIMASQDKTVFFSKIKLSWYVLGWLASFANNTVQEEGISSNLYSWCVVMPQFWKDSVQNNNSKIDD